jgi:hypothetical protein
MYDRLNKNDIITYHKIIKCPDGHLFTNLKPYARCRIKELEWIDGDLHTTVHWYKMNQMDYAGDDDYKDFQGVIDPEHRLKHFYDINIEYAIKPVQLDEELFTL